MGYLLIMRPINCAITCASVLVGAWIGRTIILPPQLILAGMIGFLICGYGNIINDLYDIEIDKINNPERPLPSGKVDRKLVILLAFFLFIMAILFSITLGWIAFFLVFGVSALLFAYAVYLKKTVSGNLVVSLISGLSFILGGVIIKNPLCMFPFLFSLFIHMPREIIKDIMDIKGDINNNVVSLPVILGKERAFTIAAFLLGILCIVLPLPYFLEFLQLKYMTIVLLFAYPIIIFCMIRFIKKPGDNELTKLSNLLRISMVVGLIAMIV